MRGPVGSERIFRLFYDNYVVPNQLICSSVRSRTSMRTSTSQRKFQRLADNLSIQSVTVLTILLKDCMISLRLCVGIHTFFQCGEVTLHQKYCPFLLNCGLLFGFSTATLHPVDSYGIFDAHCKASRRQLRKE